MNGVIGGYARGAHLDPPGSPFSFRGILGLALHPRGGAVNLHYIRHISELKQTRQKQQLSKIPIASKEQGCTTT